ncbi:MAG: hypothetical protein KA210_02985 [Bacteroidia bacterium]|jgi:hypothetical protein|nr:hypothetical protein [Bacteroidia bacterium]
MKKISLFSISLLSLILIFQVSSCKKKEDIKPNNENINTAENGSFKISGVSYASKNAYVNYFSDTTGLQIQIANNDFYNIHQSYKEKTLNCIYFNFTGNLIEGSFSENNISEINIVYSVNKELKYIEAEKGKNLSKETTVTIVKNGEQYIINYNIVLTDGTQVIGKYIGDIKEITGEGGYIIDTKINVGNPLFSIENGGYKNIKRVAWTGSKLWAITDLGGNSGTPQLLLDINPYNGSIIKSFAPEKPIWSLDYANGKLCDINSFNGNNVETYDISTGAYSGIWNYNGIYNLYYYLTFDGTNYLGLCNFTDNGYNNQALISFDKNGNVISVNKDKRYNDLVFGGGYFWASDRGCVLKLDKNLNILKVYEISDSNKFGEVKYGDEIAMQLEYINSKIWIIDRYNNFYKTTIE